MGTSSQRAWPRAELFDTGKGEVVPGSQVLWLGWPIKHRQDVKVLFQGKGLEDKLDPVLVLGGDGPSAVGIIGVAIREPWALHCPIGTLQLERAVLAWEREREQFSAARRTPRRFQRDRNNMLENHEPAFPSTSSGPALCLAQRRGRWVTDTKYKCAAPCTVQVTTCASW